MVSVLLKEIKAERQEMGSKESSRDTGLSGPSLGDKENGLFLQEADH